MKKIVLLLFTVCLFGSVNAQKRILSIGEYDLYIGGQAETYANIFKPHVYYEKFFGFGFATPIGNEKVLPIYYGNSFNLEIGKSAYYRASKFYSIGTMCKWNTYSYKLKNEGKDTFGLGVATTEGRHFFRTDNIGTGIINRFHFSRCVYMDLTLWGDLVYSKRLKIKYKGDDGKKKWKYRDGSKFNPFAAGLQIGIGYYNYSFYLRYRLTNCFNKDLGVLEPTRYSIGIRKTIPIDRMRKAIIL